VKKRARPSLHKRPAVETWIVLPDMQVPYEDRKSLHAVEKYMAAHRFDGYLNIGDFLDFDCISSHNLNNLRAVEGKRILADYDHANRILDRHQAIVRKNNPKARFVLLEGNHEQRMDRYLDANPQMEGMMEVDLNLRLDQRGIRYVKSWSKGEHFTIGKANFTHGQYTNQYHASKMVNAYGENVFYGHTHDVQCMPKVLKGADKTIVGQSLGCLCEYELSYMKGRPSNWQQAFAIFQFLPDGFFTYDVRRIFKHRFIGPDGVVYDGNDYVEPVKPKDAIWRSMSR
jgi:hypothetical protein